MVTTRLARLSAPLLQRGREAIVEVSKTEDRVGAVVLLYWKKIQAELAMADRRDIPQLKKRLAEIYPHLDVAMTKSFELLANWAWNSAMQSWRRAYELQESRASLGMDLFDPPDKDQILRIIKAPVKGETWMQRLDKWSSIIQSKEQLTNRIAVLYARGANIQEITKAILPLVRNVESTARRIARTEGMRISGEVLNESFKQAASDIVAYRIVATLDDVTRPEHRQRDGRHFLPGAEGGHPWSLPDEPNCRCVWMPVFTWDPLPRLIYDREGNLLGSGAKLLRRST